MNGSTDANASRMAEITAMTEVATALQPLDSEAVRRVLSWAADSFNTTIDFGSTEPEVDTNTNNGADPDQISHRDEFSDIADLYSAATPRNDPEKALVVAYWFQKLAGQADFDSATVNKELKHLGHGVTNITMALGSLISRKPQLVIQTRKSGSSQQARKRYKLTNEGMKQVRRMIQGEE